MAVGFPTKANFASGDVLTAAQMNDLAGTVNTVQAPLGNAAGKNVIINGAFNIWQRGTTVTPASGFGYGPDRFRTYSFAASASSLSQQAFTAGTAPVAGYEGTYFVRCASTNTATYLSQPIEDVRTFAGQTVTISFWAKSASAQTLLSTKFDQNFGSGGSTTVSTNGTPPAITTSWARYSVTVTLPSVAGKTIGAGSYLDLVITGNINNNLDIWGVQVEAGSTASNFQTATGTLQGELAACMRYFQRLNASSINSIATFAQGPAISTTVAQFYIRPQVPLRNGAFCTMTFSSSNGFRLYDYVNAANLTSAMAVTAAGQDDYSGTLFTATGSSLTQYRTYGLIPANGAAAYIDFSGEL